jgi:hypothetical protein
MDGLVRANGPLGGGEESHRRVCRGVQPRLGLLASGVRGAPIDLCWQGLHSWRRGTSRAHRPGRVTARSRCGLRGRLARAPTGPAMVCCARQPAVLDTLEAYDQHRAVIELRRASSVSAPVGPQSKASPATRTNISLPVVRATEDTVSSL